MINPIATEYQELRQTVDALFADDQWTAENGEFAFCRTLVSQLGRTGLLRHIAPPTSVRHLCFLRYAIAQKTALGDLLFAMQGLGSFPISLAGNQQQKGKYLSAVAAGESIAAFAMTEPEAGSDAASMTLRAVRKNGNYLLNGTKTLISNAGLADFYTVFARTAEGSRGITALIVNAQSAGLRVVPQELSAVHPIGRLEFRDCVVPVDQRLGEEGDGLKIAFGTLDVFRPSVAAAAVGMAERAFHEAIGYARNRKQFGKPLAEFQAIQFKLAEMYELLQASKLLVWDAASRKDNGAPRITLEAAIAKSFAAESAQRVIDQALQIHGGVGLLRGSIMERLYREIRALRIYEGTTEVLRSIIAQQILKEVP